MKMNIEKARQMFGVSNENEKTFFLFAQIPRCVILDKRPGFSPAVKMLYCYLIARCDPKQPAFTWVSQTTIANDLNVSRQTVNSHIAVLVNFGLVKIQKTDDSHNVYMITDILEVYGPAARQSWASPEQNLGSGVSKGHDRGCQRATTGGVKGPRHGGVKGPRHKEYEAKENEMKIDEIKKMPSTPPGLTLALVEVVPSKKKAKYKPGNYEAEDLELGKDWVVHSIAKLKGKSGNGYPSWTAENFAVELAKLRKTTELTHAEFRELFEFAKVDSFWSYLPLAPNQLTKHGGNGMRKIDNLIVAWQKSKTKKGNSNGKGQRPTEAIKNPNALKDGPDYYAQFNVHPPL